MDRSQLDRLRQDVKFNAELKRIYKDFPLLIRITCDTLIHDKRWMSVMASEKDHLADDMARGLYKMLVVECDDKINNEKDLQARSGIRPVVTMLQERYDKCPMKLVKTIVCCLEQESALWEEFSACLEQKKEEPMDVGQPDQSNSSLPMSFDDCSASNALNLPLMISRLQGKVDFVENLLKKASTCWVDFGQDYYMIQESRNKDLVSTTACKKLEDPTTKLHQNVLSSQHDLVTNLHESLLMANKLLPLLDKDIVQWKQEQNEYFLRVAEDPVEQLKKLSKVCADVGEGFYRLIEVCNKCVKKKLWIGAPPEIESRKGHDRVCKMKSLLQTMFKSFIQRSCIVTTQPPSILQVTSTKTSRNFPAAIRVLALEKLEQNVSVPIHAELCSETKLNGVTSSKATTLELFNGDGFLESERDPTRRVIGDFEFQVRQFKRPKKSRKATACGPDQLFVCEQKFRLVFIGSFSLTDFVEDIKLRAVSLPLTITTNSSQESDCLAAQLWQCWNTSADNNIGPYELPESVPWPKVAEMLDRKMKVETGKGLPMEQLEYLASRILGIKQEDSVNYGELKIPWSKFSKDKMEGCKFTFWRWFHAAMNLFKHYLKDEWNDGRIYGFISRPGVKKVLSSSKPGVFLLRISETNVLDKGQHITASIAPVVVAKKMIEGKAKKGFDHITPFDLEDLQLVNGLYGALQQTVDFKGTHLYPELLPFDEAFKKYKKMKVADNGPNEDGHSNYIGRTIQFKLNSPVSCPDDECCNSDEDDEDETDIDNQSLRGPLSVTSQVSDPGNWTANQMFSPESTVFSPGSIATSPGSNMGYYDGSSMMSPGSNTGGVNGSGYSMSPPSNNGCVNGSVMLHQVPNGSLSPEVNGGIDVPAAANAGPMGYGSAGQVQGDNSRPLLTQLLQASDGSDSDRQMVFFDMDPLGETLPPFDNETIDQIISLVGQNLPVPSP